MTEFLVSWLAVLFEEKDRKWFNLIKMPKNQQYNAANSSFFRIKSFYPIKIYLDNSFRIISDLFWVCDQLMDECYSYINLMDVTNEVISSFFKEETVC